MTWYLYEAEKPNYSLLKKEGWINLYGKLRRGTMESTSVLNALVFEIDELKEGVKIAQQEAKINKDLALEYKSKYEDLLEPRPKKASPEGDEREVFSGGYGGTA